MINTQKLEQIISDSLYRDNEITDDSTPPNGAKIGNGIVRQFAFHPERATAHRSEIVAMLKQLDNKFMKTLGSGSTFLNMPFEKDGSQWGEQINAGYLCAIGQALDLISFPLPRELWPSLPGSVPYVMVHDDKF